jgi:hypothetical protein
MAHFSERIFIQRPPEAVWREIQTSHDHNRTHREEMVDARVTQSTPPAVSRNTRREGPSPAASGTA